MYIPRAGRDAPRKDSRSHLALFAFIRYGRTCLWFSAAALDSKTHNQPTRRAHHNGIVGQRGRTILTLYIDDRLADIALVPTISSRSNLYGVAAFPFDDYTLRFVQMASLMDVYYAAVHQASTYTVYPYTRSCLIHDAGIRSNDSHVCASTSMAAMQGPDVYPFNVPIPCFTASLHPYISRRKHVKIRLRSRHSQVLLPHPVHAPRVADRRVRDADVARRSSPIRLSRDTGFEENAGAVSVNGCPLPCLRCCRGRAVQSATSVCGLRRHPRSAESRLHEVCILSINQTRQSRLAQSLSRSHFQATARPCQQFSMRICPG